MVHGRRRWCLRSEICGAPSWRSIGKTHPPGKPPEKATSINLSCHWSGGTMPGSERMEWSVICAKLPRKHSLPPTYMNIGSHEYVSRFKAQERTMIGSKSSQVSGYLGTQIWSKLFQSHNPNVDARDCCQASLQLFGCHVEGGGALVPRCPQGVLTVGFGNSLTCEDGPANLPGSQRRLSQTRLGWDHPRRELQKWILSQQKMVSRPVTVQKPMVVGSVAR